MMPLAFTLIFGFALLPLSARAVESNADVNKQWLAFTIQRDNFEAALNRLQEEAAAIESRLRWMLEDPDAAAWVAPKPAEAKK